MVLNVHHHRQRVLRDCVQIQSNQRVMKHIFVLDRVIILYSLTEDKIIIKLNDYLEWYRSLDNHLEDET